LISYNGQAINFKIQRLQKIGYIWQWR